MYSRHFVKGLALVAFVAASAGAAVCFAQCPLQQANQCAQTPAVEPTVEKRTVTVSCRPVSVKRMRTATSGKSLAERHAKAFKNNSGGSPAPARSVVRAVLMAEAEKQEAVVATNKTDLASSVQEDQ